MLYTIEQFDRLQAAARELNRREHGLSQAEGTELGALGCWYPKNPLLCCAREPGDLYAHCITAEHVCAEFGVEAFIDDVRRLAEALHDDVLWHMQRLDTFCAY